MSAGSIETVSRDTIAGWVAPPVEGYPRVTLLVNERPVLAVHATAAAERPGVGPVLLFFFNVRALWAFLSPADRIAVTSDGVALPTDPGVALAATTAGERGFAQLAERLDEGWVFNKKGQLQRSKLADPAWQLNVLATFEAVKTELGEGLGLTVFPCYGTLLGAVRANDFIGHDDDFDCAYISDQSSPEAVRDELVTVADRLIARGYDVTPGLTCLKVKRPGERSGSIDIFHSFFGADGIYRIPFGTAGTEPYRRDDLVGLVPVALGTHRIEVPADPEKLLAWIYGTTWRTPDPSFSWTRSCTLKVNRALPTLAQRAAIHWNNRYAAGALTEPSDAAETLAAHARTVGAVIDLGCGAGADARAFADLSADMRVIGVDRAATGLRALAIALVEEPVRGWLRIVRTDLAQPGTIEALAADARTAAGRSGVLFHARHLLDATEDASAAVIWSGLLAAAMSGDLLVLEVRRFAERIADRELQKSFRRRVDPGALVAELETAGFTIADRQDVDASAERDVLDAHRIVARRR